MKLLVSLGGPGFALVVVLFTIVTSIVAGWIARPQECRPLHDGVFGGIALGLIGGWLLPLDYAVAFGGMGGMYFASPFAHDTWNCKSLPGVTVGGIAGSLSALGMSHYGIDNSITLEWFFMCGGFVSLEILSFLLSEKMRWVRGKH